MVTRKGIVIQKVFIDQLGHFRLDKIFKESRYCMSEGNLLLNIRFHCFVRNQTVMNKKGLMVFAVIYLVDFFITSHGFCLFSIGKQIGFYS